MLSLVDGALGLALPVADDSGLGFGFGFGLPVDVPGDVGAGEEVVGGFDGVVGLGLGFGALGTVGGTRGGGFVVGVRFLENDRPCHSPGFALLFATPLPL